MTGGIKNFKGKQTSNGFNKNPQNINKKGRPKKGISFINEKLKKKGYEPATKQDIEINYMSLLQLPENELKKMIGDINQPMLIRILIKNMLSLKGFDVIEKMLDRGIGKATQINEESKKIDIEIKKENKKLLDSLIEE